MKKLLLAFCLTTVVSFAQSPPLTCTTQAASTPATRLRGQTELTGDLVIACTGGSAGPAYSVNFQVFLNTLLNSRNLNASNAASEALLIVNDPAPSAQLVQPFGAVVPGANVYQAFRSGANSVTFPGVQIVNPGSSQTITFRVVNLRSDNSTIGASANITAFVATSPAIAIANPTSVLATVAASSTGFQIRTPADTAWTVPAIDGCTGNKATVAQNTTADFNVQFTESFAGEFKKRNIATTVASPGAVADQNTPGTLYETDSGFLNTGFTATNGLNQAGLATQGTRLMARFTGIPAGVSVWVTTSAVVPGTTDSGIAARLVLTDGAGAGVYSQVTPAVGTFAPLSGDLAVWEILSASNSSLESISFGVVLSVPEGQAVGTAVSAQGSLGPSSASPAAATAPVPSFSATTVALPAAGIAACFPALTILSSCPLSPASTGTGYSFTFTASGAQPPYTWSVLAGSPPPGISLFPNGLFSGVPTTPGSYPFTVQVASSNQTNMAKSCSLDVLAPVTITTACPLPSVSIGSPYAQLMSATGGTPPYVWSLSSGSLPAGLAINANGSITGTTLTEGAFNFTLQALDSRGVSGRKDCLVRAGAPLAASPRALTFEAPAGLPTLVSQLIHVTKGIVGDPFSIQITTRDGGNWLAAAAPSGRAPDRVEVSTNAAALTPGTYFGSIIINTPGTQDSTAVNVNFQVTAAREPMLAVDPGHVQLAVPREAAQTLRTLFVTNRGPGSLNYRASVEIISGPSWLTVSLPSGPAFFSAASRLRLQFNTTLLQPGTYKARIRLDSTSTTQTLFVPVTLAVSSSRRLLGVSQEGLSFTAVAGGPAAPSQRISVLALGSGGFNWNAVTSVDQGLPSWLSLSTSGGSTSPGNPTPLDVSVNPAGLNPSVYYGEILIRSADVDNSPRLVFVSLNVLPQGTNPGVILSTNKLLFVSTVAQQAPPVQSFSIFNPSASTLRYEFLLNGSSTIWNISAPPDRLAPPGGSVVVQVGATTTGLTSGTHRATLNFQFAGDPLVRSVDLFLSVQRPSVSGNPAASTLHFAEAVCPPGGLEIVPLRQAAGFTTATGTPVAVDARVFSLDGLPLTSGAVTASLGNSTNSLKAMTYIENGLWSATLNIPPQPETSLALRIFADDPARNLTGCIDLSGTNQAQPAPSISPGGIVSAASFAPGPLAPGSIASIFGSSLSQGTNPAPAFPLPVELGGIKVAIGGGSAPLFFGSPGQLNLMLPYTLTPHNSHPLAVRRGGLFSIAEILIADAQPGLFTVSPFGQGAIVHGTDQSVVVDANRPASRGDVIVIFCEGLGAVDGPVAAGSQTPGSPLLRTILPLSVTIDGKDAEVSFSGLAPFFSGLYQINVTIPQTVTPSNTVPVVVTVSGQASNAVTIAVK
ncbi:MAG: putative Ig domain-containing protein [Acidobacteriia bacterium]|nr:putative Ig domain-containing protein [Terriglobia bacterium]